MFLDWGGEEFYPCTKQEPCEGIIDVNGASLPNKIAVETEINTDDNNAQSSHHVTLKTHHTYIVPEDREHLTDIYPVIFYDTTI